MDWLTDAMPLLVLGVLQMVLAFAIGARLLRTSRRRGDSA